MKKKHVVLGLMIVAISILAIVAAAVHKKPISSERQEQSKVTPQVATAPRPIDARASFVIFANGGIRIFSDSKYHNQSPDAFIAADDTNRVQIKKAGVTWQQFFDSLPAPMKVTSSCLYTGTGQTFCNTNTKSLKFYRNGRPQANLLQQTISEGDKILVSYGSINADVSTELAKIPQPR